MSTPVTPGHRAPLAAPSSASSGLGGNPSFSGRQTSGSVTGTPQDNTAIVRDIASPGRTPSAVSLKPKRGMPRASPFQGNDGRRTSHLTKRAESETLPAATVLKDSKRLRSPLDGGDRRVPSSVTSSERHMIRKRNTSAEYDPTANNHSYCDACGEAGQFICCDGCPSSFHFTCLESPLDSENVPSGDWYCNSCAAAMEPLPVVPAGIYTFLMHNLDIFNPLEFSLPREIISEGSARRRLQKEAGNAAQGLRKQFAEPRPSATSVAAGKGPSARRKHAVAGGSITQQITPPQTMAGPACQRCKLPVPRETLVSCGFCATTWHCECVEPRLERPPPDGDPWICDNHGGGATSATINGPDEKSKKRKGQPPTRVESPRLVLSMNVYSRDEAEPHTGQGAVGYRRTESSIKLEFLATVKSKRAMSRQASLPRVRSRTTTSSACRSLSSLVVQDGNFSTPERASPNGKTKNATWRLEPGENVDGGDGDVSEWLRSLEELRQDISSYLEDRASVIPHAPSFSVTEKNALDVLLEACKGETRLLLPNGRQGSLYGESSASPELPSSAHSSFDGHEAEREAFAAFKRFMSLHRTKVREVLNVANITK